MKIGVIIPSRGDRPRFLDNFIRMINAQILQPTLVNVVDYEPRSEKPDITQRYREGYDWFRDMKMDILCFMEDDDYYAPDYLFEMAKAWIAAGRPDLFGTSYTWYYHIKLFGYFKMQHFQRSSAMSTMIKPDMNVSWPADDQPYTDTHLWMVSGLKGKLFAPEKIICMGMKHAVGKCGGQNHNDRLDRYVNKDLNKEFLYSNLDHESFNFYSRYFENQT